MVIGEAISNFGFLHRKVAKDAKKDNTRILKGV
jgi:hypothetical protein